MRGFFLLLTTAGLLCPGLVSAQSRPPAFDVATIKPTTSDIMDLARKMQSGKSPFRIDEHRFEITFVRVRDLIAYAYEVPLFRISGPDALLDGQRWEINATLPAGSTKEQIPQMVQTLLADRFGLKIHREKKEHAIYALVVASGGLKMKEAAPSPATPAPGDAKDGDNSSAGPAGNIKPDGKGGATIGGTPVGDVRVAPSPDMQSIHMEMSSLPMAAMIQQLSQFLDRPVIDQTGLKGNYQVAFDLPISALANLMRAQGIALPGAPPGAAGGAAPGAGPADAAPDPATMNSLFKSMEKMGLKLDSRKDTLDDIVVDHVEKTPTEN